MLHRGQTIHSAPGPGVPSLNTAKFAGMAKPDHLAIWMRTKCVVIDEISMLDAEFLGYYVTRMPNTCQLIVCGDFLQLGPIADRHALSLNDDSVYHKYVTSCRSSRADDGGNLPDPAIDNGKWLSMDTHTPYGLKETTGQFAFKAMAWQQANFSVHLLVDMYRAREPLLLNALHALRRGDCNGPEIKALLTRTRRELHPRDGVSPVKLFAKKESVVKENALQVCLVARPNTNSSSSRLVLLPAAVTSGVDANALQCCRQCEAHTELCAIRLRRDEDERAAQ